MFREANGENIRISFKYHPIQYNIPSYYILGDYQRIESTPLWHSVSNSVSKFHDGRIFRDCCIVSDYNGLSVSTPDVVILMKSPAKHEKSPYLIKALRSDWLSVLTSCWERLPCHVFEHDLIQRRFGFLCHCVCRVTDNCQELRTWLSVVLRLCPCIVLLLPFWNLNAHIHFTIVVLLTSSVSVQASDQVTVCVVGVSVCVYEGVMGVSVCVKR